MTKRDDATLRCKPSDQTRQQLSSPAKTSNSVSARSAADSRYIESRLKQFALR
ncbi:MAG TPA: hypothetical protein VN541_08135 [Tepidisphaeraceae bacterium]|nr:hypothetical protein [Tepidisphaeraceae bacterium]